MSRRRELTGTTLVVLGALGSSVAVANGTAHAVNGMMHWPSLAAFVAGYGVLLIGFWLSGAAGYREANT